MRRLTGDQLKKALEKRNIATRGVSVNAPGAPNEAAMQAALAEHLRDERDELLLIATSDLVDFTKKLVRATWAVAFASAALVVATAVQIIAILKH